MTISTTFNANGVHYEMIFPVILENFLIFHNFTKPNREKTENKLEKDERKGEFLISTRYKNV